MADPRSRDFGRYLHRIRTEVFDESLRAFSKRIKISPSYIGKMENAEVPSPRRDTVIKIAGRLAMDADPFLIKAGFVPDEPQRGEDDEYLMLLIGTLDDPQRRAAVELIKLVRDANLTVNSVPAEAVV